MKRLLKRRTANGSARSKAMVTPPSRARNAAACHGSAALVLRIPEIAGQVQHARIASRQGRGRGPESRQAPRNVFIVRSPSGVTRMTDVPVGVFFRTRQPGARPPRDAGGELVPALVAADGPVEHRVRHGPPASRRRRPENGLAQRPARARKPRNAAGRVRRASPRRLAEGADLRQERALPRRIPPGASCPGSCRNASERRSRRAR